MVDTGFLTIIGGLITIYGLIILTGRKFMISRELDSIFIVLINSLNTIIVYIEQGYVLSYIYIIILPICVLIVMIVRGRYTLTNVKAQMVSATLTDILKGKGICYTQENNAVILNDYDNKRISYTQSLNSVEVNFRDIKNCFFYKQIKNELRHRIKKNKIKVFPTTGLFLIVLGIIIIAIPQYFKNDYSYDEYLKRNYSHINLQDEDDFSGLEILSKEIRVHFVFSLNTSHFLYS